MVTIIWKPCRQHGTCKSRYKARRAKAVASRLQDQRLAKKIVEELTRCNQRGCHSVGEE